MHCEYEQTNELEGERRGGRVDKESERDWRERQTETETDRERDWREREREREGGREGPGERTVHQVGQDTCMIIQLPMQVL